MVWMILFFLMTGAEAAAAQGNQDDAILDARAASLEQRYDRESDNPRRQAGIAVDLLKHRFEQLRSAYYTGDPERQKEVVETYLGALDRLESAITAARHVGTSKNTEVFLRRHVRDLGNLKTNVSYFDRPEIEKLCERAAELRAQILYSIMNPDED